MPDGKRNPVAFIIDEMKNSGATSIIPHASYRFVMGLIDQLPISWQKQDREGLIKKVREGCEMAAGSSKLKRGRMKGIKGYVYHIPN